MNQMSIRFETHFHTQETSRCGNVSAADAVAAYAEKGYQGIVVTDHYLRTFFDNRSGSWEDKANAWLAGYRAAKKQGDISGVTVLLGMELSSGFCRNEYLIYGLSEEDVLKYPELYNMEDTALYNFCHEKGWLFVQSHPFRKYITYRQDPKYLDGVEVYNGNPRHNSQNGLAAEYANLHGLLALSGSDFHEWEDLAKGGVEFTETISNMEDFVDAIKGQKYKLLET